MDKESLRRCVLKRRKALDPSTVARLSAFIVSHIVETKQYQSSQRVALYYPYKNEVDLRSLMHNSEKTFLFPRVEKGNRVLSFYHVESVDDFEKGAYGIMEPRLSCTRVYVSDIDLFLVPGVAFSREGERIGYGGGYYDATLLERSKYASLIGVAFDIQLVDSGFAEDFDQLIPTIITENGIV